MSPSAGMRPAAYSTTATADFEPPELLCFLELSQLGV
jgi:hypothetical protein